MRNLVLIFFVLLLAVSCKKKKTNLSNVEASIGEDPTAIKKIDTAYFYHPLDPKLKPYYDFAEGSYWIYLDRKNSSYDTLVLIHNKKFKTTKNFKWSDTLEIHEYETVTYTLASARKKNGGCKYCRNLTYTIAGDDITVDYELSTFGTPLTSYRVANFIQQDTVKFTDGRVFTNVNRVSFSCSVKDSNPNKTNYVFISTSYWVPNRGMIKCDEVTFKWELFDAHVILN